MQSVNVFKYNICDFYFSFIMIYNDVGHIFILGGNLVAAFRPLSFVIGMVVAMSAVFERTW